MNNCGSCRWWGPGELREDVVAAGHGVCALAETDFCGEPVHADSLAGAYGVEGNSASLLTCAGFGCVQWAARGEGQA